ncbi:MAG: type IV pilus twitching motility protein PilT [Parcubacteria group bacterium]|nr:type IV pilus twitching motility protein PilT [Parcubacteria group bacterium]
MATSNSNLINQIFQEAKDIKASDVHLLAFKPPYIRKDGVLSPLEGYEELSPKQLESLIYSILIPEQKEKFISEKELDLSYQIADGTRFRVNLHWEKNVTALAARLIPTRIPSLQDLNLGDIVYELLHKPAGLVLVTGPTGCGKSTTLASMIDAINQERAAHIITLEDPIEFVYQSKKSIIAQRQLGIDMVNFEEGLKHVLRQDPNVILVGEMRDTETISTTITLAETGHLVFATLHTYSAPQTIDRIIDSFPPHQQNQVRSQLSMTLQAVISQRLLPKIKGGRVAAREVMTNNSAISNLIREGKIAQMRSVIQTSADEGMNTMDQALVKLVRDGALEAEVALPYLENPQLLDK